MARFFQLGRPFIGAVLCALVALLVSAIFAQWPMRAFVPLAFVAVIVVLGLRFGMWASILGACVSALIFTWFMLPPLASVQVSDKVERSNIAWMLLAGIVIPYLLVGPKTKQMK